MTQYRIEYLSRRQICFGVDIEDQKWRVAAGETVEGTEAQADEHARCLDADTDGAFIHRAVPMPAEPEDAPEENVRCQHCPGLVGVAGWAGTCSPCWAKIEERVDARRRAS